MNTLLTVRQAAAMLGVCKQTIRDLADKGHIRYERNRFGWRLFQVEEVSRVKMWRESLEEGQA
jgi:excisionase family DNA binding protein